MAVDNADGESSTYTFPGGYKQDVEARLDNLKKFSESDAAKKFEAQFENEYEVIVTVTERRKA